MGAAAPWSTGCARSGFRRLGKMAGRVLLSAVPSVWGCREEDCWMGIRACTTRMWPAGGLPSSGMVSEAVVRDAEVGR